MVPNANVDLKMRNHQKYIRINIKSPVWHVFQQSPSSYVTIMSPLSSLCRNLDPPEEPTFIRLVRNRNVPGDRMMRLGKETYPKMSGELSVKVAWSRVWIELASWTPARIPGEAWSISPSSYNCRSDTTAK